MQLVVAVGSMVQVSYGSVLVVQVWFSCWVRFGADVAQIGLVVVQMWCRLMCGASGCWISGGSI